MTANNNCLASQNNSKPLCVPLHILIQFTGNAALTIIRSNWVQKRDCPGGIQDWHTSRLCTPIWWHLQKSPRDTETAGAFPFSPNPVGCLALELHAALTCRNLPNGYGNETFCWELLFHFSYLMLTDDYLFITHWLLIILDDTAVKTDIQFQLSLVNYCLNCPD